MKTTPNYGLTIYEPNDITAYMSASGWNGTMEKLDTDMNGIQTQVTTSATNLATLEQQVSTDHDEINTLTSEVSDLTTTVQGNTANIAGLDTRITQTNTTVAGLQQDIAGIDEQIGQTFRGVLSKGETTLAITIGEFTNTSLVDVYSGTYGVNPLTIELRAASGGQPNLCVTTWDAQTDDMDVAVVIK